MLLRWLFRGASSGGRRQYHETRPRHSFPVRVLSIQDGDSLVIRPAQSGSEAAYRVRLYAIDAPEREQQYGREARDYLRRLVWNRTDLMIEIIDTDQFGRLVGVLYYRATDRRRSINRLMVAQGLAYWYSAYGGHGLGLEQAEQAARRRRRGVWASGRQVAPWQYRRERRAAAEGTGCLRWLLLGVAGAAAWAAIWFVITL